MILLREAVMSVVPKATKRATTLTQRNLHIDSSLTLNRIQTRFSTSKFNLTKLQPKNFTKLNIPQHFLVFNKKFFNFGTNFEYFWNFKIGLSFHFTYLISAHNFEFSQSDRQELCATRSENKKLYNPYFARIRILRKISKTSI